MSTSGSFLPVTGAGAGCSRGRWRPPLSPRMMNSDDDCTILLREGGWADSDQPVMSFQPATWRLMVVAVSVPVSITGKCLFTAWIFNLFLNLITVIISWEQTEDRLSLLPASTKSGSCKGVGCQSYHSASHQRIWWATAQRHVGSPQVQCQLYLVCLAVMWAGERSGCVGCLAFWVSQPELWVALVSVTNFVTCCIGWGANREEKVVKDQYDSRNKKQCFIGSALQWLVAFSSFWFSTLCCFLNNI